MDYSKLLQPLLETIIIVVVPALGAFVAAWLRKQTALVQAQIPQEQMYLLEQLAGNFVRAAEQTGLSAEVAKTGAQKKAAVLAALQAAADARKIPVSVAELESVIESAVLSLPPTNPPAQ